MDCEATTQGNRLQWNAGLCVEPLLELKVYEHGLAFCQGLQQKHTQGRIGKKANKQETRARYHCLHLGNHEKYASENPKGEI